LRLILARSKDEMMLEVKDIHVSYDGLEALKGISLQVGEGSIVSIIGPNGAGKTTTLKTICGGKRPSAGEIWHRQRRIDGLATEEIIGLRIAHVPEGRRVFPRITVLENLQMGAYLLKDKKVVQTNLAMVSKFFPILDARRRQAGGSLSGGEQQMLAIGRALMSSPELILMDEPTLGLSPIVCRNLSKIIANLNQEQGITILLVEQNAKMALSLATWGYVLEGGKIALEDTCENLRKTERVIQIYLGQ
jgi:branched-chain amino acid transport system ATP-binding protein